MWYSLFNFLWNCQTSTYQLYHFTFILARYDCFVAFEFISLLHQMVLRLFCLNLILLRLDSLTAFLPLVLSAVQNYVHIHDSFVPQDDSFKRSPILQPVGGP